MSQKICGEKITDELLTPSIVLQDDDHQSVTSEVEQELEQMFTSVALAKDGSRSLSDMFNLLPSRQVWKSFIRWENTTVYGDCIYINYCDNARKRRHFKRYYVLF